MTTRKLRPIADKVIMELGEKADELILGDPKEADEPIVVLVTDCANCGHKHGSFPCKCGCDPTKPVTPFEIQVLRYVELGESIKDMEHERGELRGVLEFEAAKNGGTVRASGFDVKTTFAMRNTLVKEKLLENGVSMATIERSTTASPYTTLTVKRAR